MSTDQPTGAQDRACKGAEQPTDGPTEAQVQVWVGGTGVTQTSLVTNVRPGSGPDKVAGVTQTPLVTNIRHGSGREQGWTWNPERREPSPGLGEHTEPGVKPSADSCSPRGGERLMIGFRVRAQESCHTHKATPGAARDAHTVG